MFFAGSRISLCVGEQLTSDRRFRLIFAPLLHPGAAIVNERAFLDEYDWALDA
jgi:hypothetical protein